MQSSVLEAYDMAKPVLGLDNYGEYDRMINQMAMQAIKSIPIRFAFKEKTCTIKVIDGVSKIPNDFHSISNNCINRCIDKIDNCNITFSDKINGTKDISYHAITTDENNNLLFDESLLTLVKYYIIKEIALSKSYSSSTRQKFAPMARDYNQMYHAESDRLRGELNNPDMLEKKKISDMQSNINFEIRR